MAQTNASKMDKNPFELTCSDPENPSRKDIFAGLMSLLRATTKKTDAQPNHREPLPNQQTMEDKQVVVSQNEKSVAAVQDKIMEKTAELDIVVKMVLQEEIGNSCNIEGISPRNNNNMTIKRSRDGIKGKPGFKYLWTRSGGTWMKKNKDAAQTETQLFQHQGMLLVEFRQHFITTTTKLAKNFKQTLE
jgi:hypothetical protein